MGGQVEPSMRCFHRGVTCLQSQSSLITSVVMIRTSNSLLLSALLLVSFLNVCVQSTAQDALPSTIASPDAGGFGTEDFSDLALKGSHLQPAKPLSGQVDNFPKFTRELVRVQWRDADPIDLYIVRPIGVAHPPVILYLYGYPGEAVRFLNPALCETVTRHGYAAVGFSSMLTGQRYHDVPMKEWFVSDLHHSLVGTTHDVQMILNYLGERGDFDMSRVGMFGEGSGGTVALLAGSVDRRIRAVDVLNPWGAWPSWFAESPLVPDFERPDYLKPEFQKPIAGLDPVNILPSMTHPSIRLQQNMWDASRTPVRARDQIAAALRAKQDLAQYKDKQDYYDRVGHDGQMLDWMYLALNRSPGNTPGSR
jgi:hypothetical protein